MKNENFYINVSISGNKIYHKYYDSYTTSIVSEEVDFQPSLFFKDKTGCSQIKSMVEKIPLKETVYKSINEYFSTVKEYKEIGNVGLYGEINPIYQFISHHYPQDEIKIDLKKMRILYFDIETESAPGIMPDPENPKFPILSISAYDSFSDNYYVWGYKDLTKPQTEFTFYRCSDEKDMLSSFIDFWMQDDYPDLVIGWNSEKFDIPYLYQRTALILPGAKNAFSPIKQVRVGKKVDDYFNKYMVCDIKGINHIDFMKYYKKLTYEPRISYALDYIAEEEIGAKKIDYSEYGNLNNLYKMNYDLFIYYNFIDSKLMKQINDAIKLLELICTMSSMAKVNIEDVFSPVRTWDVYTYNFLKRENLILEPNLYNESEQYEGAYVSEPVPGLYRDIVSADVTSEYPNLIRWLNIGNETIRNLDNGNCSKSASGHYFDKTSPSVYSKMITVVFDKRVSVRNELKIVKNKIQEIDHEILSRSKNER
jgi:DNA polymerase elongation subunit (family B)